MDVSWERKAYNVRRRPCIPLLAFNATKLLNVADDRIVFLHQCLTKIKGKYVQKSAVTPKSAMICEQHDGWRAWYGNSCRACLTLTLRNEASTERGTESVLCNNKLLGGPINQTEIASVGGMSSARARVTMRRWGRKQAYLTLSWVSSGKGKAEPPIAPIPLRW